MTPQRIAAAAALAGLVLLAVLHAAGVGVTPSWLLAWLVFVGLPLGALPLVLGAELAGWSILPPLRRMLWLMPVAALCAVPLGLRLGPLLERHAGAFPPGWLVPEAVRLRGLAMLLAWTVLALLFAAPPRRPRPGRAAIALMLHLAMGTLAAVDWVMAFDPALASSLSGLLLMAAWSGTALSAALFVLALRSEGRVAPDAAPLLAVVLGAWVVLHLIQYLVTWSANLPREIVWYQARTAGWGGPALWFAASAAGLAALAMVPEGLLRIPPVLASLAAMLLLVHALEMAWLVTPGLRGTLALTLADAPALLALSGLAALVLIGRRGAHATA